MSDSVWPHKRQLIRLPCLWDFPGKNTGVGCHFLLQYMKVKGKVKSLSCVRLFATPWTTAYQPLPSTGVSRQEYWSGLPLPSPMILWGEPFTCGIWLCLWVGSVNWVDILLFFFFFFFYLYFVLYNCFTMLCFCCTTKSIGIKYIYLPFLLGLAPLPLAQPAGLWELVVAGGRPHSC